jgi:hypothetical protein
MREACPSASLAPGLSASRRTSSRAAHLLAATGKENDVTLRHEQPNPDLRRDRGIRDARATRRLPAFGTAIRLGWWEGPEFRTAAGVLKNISRGGVCALAEAAPPDNSPVVLRLTGPRHTEWVEATVLEVSKSRWFRRLPRLVRIQFREPCSSAFLRASLDILPFLATEPADESREAKEQFQLGMRPRSRGHARSRANKAGHAPLD